MRPLPGAEADRDLHLRAQEIHERRGGVQAQVDVGMLFVEIRQPRQQPLLQEGGEHAHHQRPGAAVDAGFIHRPLERFETGPDLGEEALAFAGELDHAAASAKKGRAQVFLERADLHAHRADAYAESVGGAGEGQMLCSGYEDPQACQGQAPRGS